MIGMTSLISVLPVFTVTKDAVIFTGHIAPLNRDLLLSPLLVLVILVLLVLLLNSNTVAAAQDQDRCKSTSLLCSFSLEQPPTVCLFIHFSFHLQETSEDTSLCLSHSPKTPAQPMAR